MLLKHWNGATDRSRPESAVATVPAQDWAQWYLISSDCAFRSARSVAPFNLPELANAPAQAEPAAAHARQFNSRARIIRRGLLSRRGLSENSPVRSAGLAFLKSLPSRTGRLTNAGNRWAAFKIKDRAVLLCLTLTGRTCFFVSFPSPGAAGYWAFTRSPSGLIFSNHQRTCEPLCWRACSAGPLPEKIRAISRLLPQRQPPHPRRDAFTAWVINCLVT